MATAETPVQLPRFCYSDSEGHVFCTFHRSTFFTTTYTENAAMSTSYLTITTSEGIYASPIPPRATAEIPTYVGSERPTVGMLPIIITIAGGLLLLGSFIGLCVWTCRTKRKELYPGHQVLGMLGRSGTNGAQGGAAAQSVNGGPAMEMTGGLSSMDAPNASGGAASPASSLATVPAPVPVVGRIDGVLAGERSETGKASSGEGGLARYA